MIPFLAAVLFKDMKIKIGRQIIFLLMIVSVLLTSSITTLLYSQYILPLTLLESILLIITLLFVLFPVGKTVIGKEITPIYKFSKWIFCIFLLQLLWQIIWFALGISSLENTAENLSSSEKTSWLLIFWLGNLIYQGMHPWALIACLASTIGLADKLNHPKVSGSIYLIKKNAHPSIASAIDITATGATLFILYLLANFAATSLLNIFAYYQIIPAVVENKIGTIMTMLLIGVLLSQKSVLQKIKLKTNQQNHLAGTFLIIFTIFVVIMSAYGLTLTLIPFDSKKELTSYISPVFISDNAKLSWGIISWSLAIFALPIMSSYLAYISRGRTVRQLILAIMAFPLITAFCINNLAKNNEEIFNAAILNSINKLMEKPISYIFIFTVFLLVMLIWRFNKNLNTAFIRMTANLAGKNMRRMRQNVLLMAALLPWLTCLNLLTGIGGLHYLLLSLALIIFSFCFLPSLVMLFKIAFKPNRFL